ncbi:MAG: hypothetical protein ACRDD2_02260 [Sarcina sp.]
MNDLTINKYHCETFIQGTVLYEDLKPVKSAIVILEMLCNSEEEGEIAFYSKTNCKGEFCFSVTDLNHCYKLKVFNSFKCDEIFQGKFYIDMC